MINPRPLLFAVCAALAMAGCQGTLPKEALELPPELLKVRQLQTRMFETPEEARLLSAGAQVLQDLGFNLDESESRLGVIVASKDRSAVQSGEVAVALLVSVLAGQPVPFDSAQKIRAALVTRPVQKRKEAVAMRVTFQRIVWNNNGQVTKLETLDDPKLYREFFANLSKAVFLEAHEI